MVFVYSLITNQELAQSQAPRKFPISNYLMNELRMNKQTNMEKALFEISQEDCSQKKSDVLVQATITEVVWGGLLEHRNLFLGSEDGEA